MSSRAVSWASLVPDVQSRRIIREFVLQTSLGALLMLAFSTLRAQTLPELGHAARQVFMFYSVIDYMRAVFNREPLGGPSLNRWDQAAAYTLCALFLDLMLNWPA